MDFKRNPLLLLSIGLFVGIVVAEVVYCFYAPTILPDGSIEVVTNRDYYPEVSQLLRGAQESIHIIMFSANYQTGPDYADAHVNELVQELVAARNRGVDVQVIMDSWPEGNEKSLQYLLKNNVVAKKVQDVGTTHAKLIIIDGKLVVVGSTNWSHYSVDLNNEANVVVNNERIAQEFEGYFTGLSSLKAS